MQIKVSNALKFLMNRYPHQTKVLMRKANIKQERMRDDCIEIIAEAMANCRTIWWNIVYYHSTDRHFDNDCSMNDTPKMHLIEFFFERPDSFRELDRLVQWH